PKKALRPSVDPPPRGQQRVDGVTVGETMFRNWLTRGSRSATIEREVQTANRRRAGPREAGNGTSHDARIAENGTGRRMGRDLCDAHEPVRIHAGQPGPLRRRAEDRPARPGQARTAV